MADFIHLHNHSHYSILDGITKIPELVSKAKSFGQNAVALTDHGNMFGIMEFHKECKKQNITPIYGAELYIAPKSRFEKDKDEKYYHIVLLAKDNDGYKNLLKLVSLGYLEGFYSKPRIDKDLLQEYSKGLIVLTACIGGEIPSLILSNKEKELNESIKWHLDVFGKENFYLELQNHFLSEEAIVNKKMIEIAKRMDISLVVTNDTHYLHKEDSKLQEIVFAIRDKNTLKDPNRYRFPNDEFYFKPPEVMEKLFEEIPEALLNTKKIAEMCQFELKFGKHLPLFHIPEKDTTDSYLARLCNEGLRKRFKNEVPPDYIERLNKELELIKKMGFSNYFLIVSDFVRYARANGILVGTGRGSAAGALISYALFITDVDPIRYGLLFERFLNPERVSMPDIDVDFQDDRRDEVKEYIRTKYGYNKTADIITFGLMKSRASLKDVGRVLEIPLDRVNKITKLIDNKTANEALSDIIPRIPELREIVSKGTKIEKEWIEYSAKLDGTIRNIGTHASGLIISDVDLMEVIPLYRDASSGLVSTQYEGDYLEENGLLKMDILGLTNLTMIKDCLSRIRKNHNVKLDIESIPLDDPEVFKLFGNGETMGIFQFESAGMTDYLKKLKPTCIDDLIAMNALYRPGPMDYIPTFIARKHGKEAIDCFDTRLEPILKSTYGVIVYQEQVMQIAQVLAGFSLGKADIVRRMMAKKKPEELDKIRPEWIDGAKKQGFSQELAEKLFEILIPFSNYAFNKSHSAAYAILAYQIAYLKTHYKLEFLSSLLSLNMSSSDYVRLYCQEAIKNGIKVFPPDINESNWEFRETIRDNQPVIIFGFGGIKGLGEAFSDAIVEERTLGGHFHSFEDFVRRMIKYPEFKKASIEILIKAGCFDRFFSIEKILQEKANLLYNLDAYISAIQKKMEDQKSGKMGLFDGSEGDHLYLKNNIKPLSLKEEFENEVSIFGFYLSGKLFEHYSKQFGLLSHCSQEIISKLSSGTGVLIWGFINNLSLKIATNNKTYAIMSVDNGIANLKFYLFSEKYEQYKSCLVENNFVMIRMNVTEGKNGNQFEIVSIKPIQYLPQERFTELHICLENNDTFLPVKEHLQKIKKMAEEPSSRGIINIIFHVIANNKSITIRSSDKYRIKYSTDLMREISRITDIKGYWLY